jgi:hypothetical protein
VTALPLRGHDARHAGRRTLLARGATVLSVVVASLFVGGVAFAWWSTTGSGSGTGATGTVVALTTTGSTPSGTALVPGGSAPLVITVTNPNPRAVAVTSVSLDGTRSVGTTGSVGACTAPPLAVSATTSLTVPAGATQTFTVPSAVTLGSGAASGCQGAVFTIPVTLSGRTS